MNVLPIPYLPAGSAPVFPDPEQAMSTPNGLLALGGDLSVPRLLAAYGNGIFPWFGENEPILWWSPDPRCVFATEAVHISRSLRRQLRRCDWELRIDTAFARVLEACAAPRPGQQGTWLVPAMREAYLALHAQGHAHSIEIWSGAELVGGLYGVAVGRLFCGESMFSAHSGGSKAALVALCQRLHAAGCPWLDAQVPNSHLLTMGATELPRARFLGELARLSTAPVPAGLWRTGSAGPLRELIAR